ncbi:chitooligosaccharide synthase NodC [Microvirga tunisiensis]|uniref:N-acetylglucosaminyltransferase n=1 Tax=Microvirga tunisiensis TaxID=2108360 RepID=A0A5N7MUF2_9HYPH|nr:chitooligosaccharide synthase NodC [Microvirga tunisiensis]MPR12144.1 chitooligosaccharide synthase NodC [Microvirga tunisiensis]MPR30099.1 chitooligosaccharide synthase NodC [Microvirga tunisiensis]
MDLLATTSTVAVSLYALISTVYRTVQLGYALPTHVSSALNDLVGSRRLLSVDVIVPCFNEDPRTLSACLASVANQDYPRVLQAYVIDDCSNNRNEVESVHDAYTHDPRFNFILLDENIGKRKAQIVAIRRSSGDLVLNVNSDTIIASDVVTKLVLKMQDPAIGAAMGQLTASNRSDTWLTRLIDMEYWLACNEERAAQARFGAVMCCCGPCAIYRRSALRLLLDQYETQLFRGIPSNFGENRHLTILMLKAGFRTEYVPDAIAATVVPDRLGSYPRQQLRWARSTYRDTLLALRLLPGLDRYLALDVVGQNLGPLFLALSALAGLAQLTLTASVPWWTGLIIASMTIVRCSVTALRARQLRFLSYALHTPINLILLLPVKAYALCTLSTSDWLSRSSANDVPDRDRKQAIVQSPITGSSATDSSGIAAPFCRLDLTRDSLTLATSDGLAATHVSAIPRRSRHEAGREEC